jgi:hypothetical protein
MQTTHEIDNTTDDMAPEDATGPLRLLVVINQREALIFRSEEKGTIPDHVHPDDPAGALKHLKQTEGADAAAHGLQNIAYYKEIAAELIDADEIILIGNASGSSSAMHHLKDFLETHDADIAKKIVGALTVDIEAMTTGELLKEARAFSRQHPGLPT